MIKSICAVIQYRDLILGLAAKDLKIKYKNAFFGFLWSLLMPLFLAFIFFIVFTKVIPMGIERFPIFLLCALFPWNFVQLCLSAGTVSIVTSGNLIKKVYFPREAIPVSVVLSNAYNFILSMIILMAIILFSGIKIKLVILYLPLIIACQLIFTLGLVLVFSGLHTYYRDVKYIVEMFLLGWFYMTPIFYPHRLIPEAYRPVYMLNPMAVFVNLYREIMLYGTWPAFSDLSYIALSSLLLYLIGSWVFRRYDPLFADMV